MLALNSPDQEGSFETLPYDERFLVHPQYVLDLLINGLYSYDIQDLR